MANTVHGPYTFTNWTGTTPISTANLTTALSQAGIALHSFNPYFVTAGYVVYGVACVKDATTASQINITNGEAFLIMTDGTIALIDVVATSQTTVTTNTTYYLDLNPDGTWSWATSHSAQANYLPICQVTTDGSGNISGVSDKRVMRPQLLTNSALPSVGQPGGSALPVPLSVLTTQNASLAATVNGGVTFGQTGALRGSMDGAALFNGTSGYVQSPAASSAAPIPAGNAAWSLECWLKFSAAPASDQCALALGASASGQEVLIDVQATTGKLYTAINGGTQIIAGSGASVGAWHHVAVIYDSTSIRLYVDGSLAAGPTAPGVTVNMGQSGLFIGIRAGLTQYFSGTLDEVALYAVALSSTRISAHYNAGISATTDAYAATVLADAPLRYYRLGDAVGAATVADTTSPTAQTLVTADGQLQVGPMLSAAQYGQALIRFLTSPAYIFDLLTPLVGSVATLIRFITYSGSATQVPLALGDATPTFASTVIAGDGHISQLAGQATAGGFGVPVIVAQAFAMPVTTTSARTVATFSAPSNGLYRVSLTSRVQNPTSPATISAYVLYREAVSGSTETVYFTLQGNVPANTSPLILHNASVPTANTIAAYSVIIYVGSGGGINVTYQDSTGTPSDFVSAIIERLS